MDPLRSEDDRRAVAARIAAIERETAGEVVVRIVDQSDDYAFHRLLFAAGASAVLAEGLSLTFPWLSAYALEIAVAAAVALWFILGTPALLHRFLPKALEAGAVHRRAQAAFVEDGVHRTRDASGVLIFISRFEHRVEILADAGIHRRVGTEGWDGHVKTIVAGIKAGEATRGVLSALDAIGAELKAGFPPRSDDENELADHVIDTKR